MRKPRPARRVYCTVVSGWRSKGGRCWRATRQGIADRKLIEADERRVQATTPAPGVTESNIGSIDFLMPQKTHNEKRRAAASLFFWTANWASNSTGGRYPSAECRRFWLYTFSRN